MTTSHSCCASLCSLVLIRRFEKKLWTLTVVPRKSTRHRVVIKASKQQKTKPNPTNKTRKPPKEQAIKLENCLKCYPTGLNEERTSKTSGHEPPSYTLDFSPTTLDLEPVSRHPRPTHSTSNAGVRIYPSHPAPPAQSSKQWKPHRPTARRMSDTCSTTSSLLKAIGSTNTASPSSSPFIQPELQPKLEQARATRIPDICTSRRTPVK